MNPYGCFHTKKDPKNISPLAQEEATKQDWQVAGTPKAAM